VTDNILDLNLSESSALERVEYLMARLRDPKTGCPWDKKQTFASIAPYTIEETYEVVDTIEREDYTHLKEELGDLLFQVVFYAQMAAEEQRFNLHDIADTLVEKLVRRHPHVFPAGTLASYVDTDNPEAEETIRQRWDQIKQQEKQAKGESSPDSVLGDIPIGMTPLIRAEKLQKQAAKVGFEWDSVEPVVAKLQEEIAELTDEVVQPYNMDAIADELGDVMFSCVNVARHFGLNAEMVMKQANRKFERRFMAVEKKLKDQGVAIENAALADMEAQWQQAKLDEPSS